MELTPDGILAAVLILVGSTAGSIVWIEKRFRDSKRETETAVTNAQTKQAAALDLSTAEHRNSTARISSNVASLHRELATVQLNHAKELRDYPTKSDFREMADSVHERVDKIETKIDGLINRRRGI